MARLADTPWLSYFRVMKNCSIVDLCAIKNNNLRANQGESLRYSVKLNCLIMKDAECSLVDNLIAEKLILPTFRPDAPVLLGARVKLSRGTSQFIGSSGSKVAAC